MVAFGMVARRGMRPEAALWETSEFAVFIFLAELTLVSGVPTA